MPDSVITPEEPVSLALAKQQLRVIDNNSEDVLISSYIRSAREWVEHHTSAVLVRRQFTEHFDGFGRNLIIRKHPIIVVDSLRYIDRAGGEQVYEGASGRYEKRPFRLYPALGRPWPATHHVTVTYTAGYGPLDAPAQLVQAMLLLIGHWYANRGDGGDGNVPMGVSRAVLSLCRDHRSSRV
jgi:uncharacterized phiE125 gp8 family phage protein